MSDFDDDDPAGETRVEGDLTPLEALPPSAFGALPSQPRPQRSAPLGTPPAPQRGAPQGGAPRPPPPPPPPAPPTPPAHGKFAAPPPSEAGRFVQPVHETKPVTAAPPTYFDQAVTEPPRSMVLAIGVSASMALLMAVAGAPSMLLVPGCAPAQIIFTALVAITCWRGRSYGRPLAVIGALAWMFAAALAIRGQTNMVTTLSFESVQRGQMPNVVRLVIVVRAAWEAFLVWTLFRPDTHKYFAHRARTDAFGGRNRWS